METIESALIDEDDQVEVFQYAIVGDRNTHKMQNAILELLHQKDLLS